MSTPKKVQGTFPKQLKLYYFSKNCKFFNDNNKLFCRYRQETIIYFINIIDFLPIICYAIATGGNQ
jgi:hypothetical protein